MKPYLFLAAWLLGSLTVCCAQQGPFGQYVTSFPIGASRLLADPTRPRVYASVPSNNTVAVIDVDTLSVATSIPVGKKPGAMAISRDGATLYVLNAANGIDVLDLDTLQARATIPLPAVGFDIAAGLNGQLYVYVADPLYQLIQVDSATGAVQAPSALRQISARFLQISPDGRVLYGDDDELSAFDVSGPTPVFLAKTSYTQPVQGNSLTLSHNGQYLCAPGSGGGYGTLLYSTAQLGGYYGLLLAGTLGGGPCAFSADDTLLYQTGSGIIGSTDPQDQPNLELFDTSTFTLVDSTPLPQANPAGTAGYNVGGVTLDNTGRYLFMSQVSTYYVPEAVLVVSTGRGTTVAPVPLPAVSIAAVNSQIQVEGNRLIADYDLLRLGGDLTAKLKVPYTVTGIYPDGTRKVLEVGKIKFAADQSAVRFRVFLTAATGEGPDGTFPSKITVKLTPEAAYTLTSPSKVKVKVTQ